MSKILLKNIAQVEYFTLHKLTSNYKQLIIESHHHFINVNTKILTFRFFLRVRSSSLCCFFFKTSISAACSSSFLLRLLISSLASRIAFALSFLRRLNSASGKRCFKLDEIDLKDPWEFFFTSLQYS